MLHTPSHPQGSLLLHVEHFNGENFYRLPVLWHRAADRPLRNVTHKTWDHPISLPPVLARFCNWSVCFKADVSLKCAIFREDKRLDRW